MEKYNVKNHLFYDGYNLNECDLKDKQYIDDFLKKVNKYIFNNKGKITIIPYFNGKVELNGGISGVIVGPNFHFTCHTFCFKNTVFIDYYGDDKQKDILLEMILKTFKTDNYSLGSKDTPGNFGKHIIIESSPIKYYEVAEKINEILEKIKMTSISELLINKANDSCFDVLQPIAESHISIHQHNNKLIMGVFSCKNFNTEKLLQLINNINSVIAVNRGLQFK